MTGWNGQLPCLVCVVYGREQGEQWQIGEGGESRATDWAGRTSVDRAGKREQIHRSGKGRGLEWRGWGLPYGMPARKFCDMLYYCDMTAFDPLQKSNIQGKVHTDEPMIRNQKSAAAVTVSVLIS